MGNQTDFWAVVRNRRSVRSFTDQPVEQILLEKLIEAGTRAPNAHNRQSWRFVVLTDRQKMVDLAEQMGVDYYQALLKSSGNPSEAQRRVEQRHQRLTGAPVVVVLCVDTADLDHYDDDNRRDGEYLMAVQSAAMAGSYMLLAAQALGLSGVWMCAPLFAPDRVRSALDLPETWVAQGLLLLGYPVETPEFRQRKPIDDVVRWG